jgi:hypothetical protein
VLALSLGPGAQTVVDGELEKQVVIVEMVYGEGG